MHVTTVMHAGVSEVCKGIRLSADRAGDLAPLPQVSVRIMTVTLLSTSYLQALLIAFLSSVGHTTRLGAERAGDTSMTVATSGDLHRLTIYS
jgi:hypothetical protein